MRGNKKRVASDECDIADWKVALVGDVVALNLTLVPVLIRVVDHRDHFSTPDLQLFITACLEVVVYVHLRLTAHNAATHTAAD